MPQALALILEALDLAPGEVLVSGPPIAPGAWSLPL